MGYHNVLVSEARLPLGGEYLYINALHGIRSLHEGESAAAYEDGDRHIRISSYALLRSPQRVLRELVHLSRGRWTKQQAVSAVSSAYHQVRGRLAVR